MKIQWLGHSAFKLTESTGTSIITDPFEPSAVGYGMAYTACDAVTLSHPHSDRNNIKGVKGSPLVIDKSGSYDVKGIGISGISTFPDEDSDEPKVENIIYKYRLDGVTVCHLGSIGESCSPELLEQIIPCNVLLIPVGGNLTIDSQQAIEFVERIMPDIVIPMHYKIKHCELDIDKVDAFLKHFEDEQIEEIEDNHVELDRSDFDFEEDTKVIILPRYKG